MGQLAAWGLLEGAGKSAIQGAELEEKRRDEEIARKHELALRAVEHQYTKAEIGQQIEGNQAVAGMQIAGQTGIASMEQTGQNARTAATNTSQEKQVGMQQTAESARNTETVTAQGTRQAAVNASQERIADKYASRAGAYPGAGFDFFEQYTKPIYDENGVQVDETTGTYDKRSGVSWVQRGSQFRPDGYDQQIIESGKIKSAGLPAFLKKESAAYYKALGDYMEGNTVKAKKFKQMFGYWPPDEFIFDQRPPTPAAPSE